MKFLSVILVLVFSLCFSQAIDIFTCRDGSIRGASSITFQGGRVRGIIAGFSCYENKDDKSIFTYPPFSFTTIPRQGMDGSKFEGNAIILDFKNILNTYQFDSASIKYNETSGETIVTITNPHVVLNPITDPNRD